jgi:hypothetical protein
MNYYLARGTSEPKVIGIKDGTYQARLIRNELTDTFTFDYFQRYIDGWDKPYWTLFDTFPEQNLNVELVELKGKAKRTDFISFYPNAKGNGEFLLSKRAADIFRTFNLPRHQFFPTTIIHNGEILDSYEYLFCPCLGYEYIDFRASSFFKGLSHSFDKEYVTINNASEWEQYKHDGLLNVDNIVLKGVNKDMDYFSVKVAVINFFISERLKTAIEQEKLKGLNILPIREPYEPRIELR